MTKPNLQDAKITFILKKNNNMTVFPVTGLRHQYTSDSGTDLETSHSY